ncbi:diguanylate cyclase (GGDEF)-like protein [Neorhizobium alkalisoli]|uniref:diguanylate cyclase n=2 Tax=Neorhizobium alkalisoli TaxID=528178 RepID=A0A561QXC4_9HYPH|nr:diguanylate cyclase (GGDEF)-like protein [Neorhizobium alkalisoli]
MRQTPFILNDLFNSKAQCPAMRISEITNWAYAVTVVLTALSGGAFILSSQSASVERLAIEERQTLGDLGEQLALGAEERSDAARLYVMTGEARYLDVFRGDESEENRLDGEIVDIRRFGATAAELSVLTDVEAAAQALDKLEKDTIAAYPQSEKSAVQEALFGADHERLQTGLLANIDRFRELVSVRTDGAVADAQAKSDWWGLIAKTMLAITAVVFLSVLYFILRRRVALPLVHMTGIVSRLARQDYAVEVPLDVRRDEIGDMNQAIHVFRENGLERERLDAERRADQRTKDLILQMMHRLQACHAEAELAEVVSCFSPQIFPELAGNLYVLNDSRTQLTKVGAWLEPRHATDAFPSSACWGLRRGRPHLSYHRAEDIACPHLVQGAGEGVAEEIACLCVPLTAQGDTIGLLCFEEREGHAMAPENSRLYLELIAENIGLAVANLQLRDRLMKLAVRDALTGLLNRRCLDEALTKFAREGSGLPVSCLMIDIDRFKHFNDEFGHDAGDKVMQYVAQIILDTVGSAGTCYRFGGEEFTVLLRSMSDKDVFELAERLRERIATTPLSHGGRILGLVSVSIGVAEAVSAGAISTLVTRADAALYEAKSRGRNQTVTARAMVLAHDAERVVS